MLKRIILFISFLFIYSMSYSQYNWTSGKLILKDGDSLEGFIQIPMNVVRLVSFGKSKVEFKENMEDRVRNYDKSQIDRIYFNTYDANSGYYEFAPLKKRKFRLFKVLLSGKAKLYTRTVAIEHVKTINGNPNSQGIVKYYYEEEDEFYIIREGESSLTPLISHYSLKEFKKTAISYFSDCKDIIGYLNNDLYNEIDVIELVNDYNLICE